MNQREIILMGKLLALIALFLMGLVCIFTEDYEVAVAYFIVYIIIRR